MYQHQNCMLISLYDTAQSRISEWWPNMDKLIGLHNYYLISNLCKNCAGWL